MARIRIEQLDEDGRVWRTFDQSPAEDQVPERLHAITYAYNLKRTRVFVNDVLQTLTRAGGSFKVW